MNKNTKQYKYWLLAIFLTTVAIRLILAFTTPNFTYDSYFHLKQVEHITDTGLPLYQDTLSYSGRELRFLPFFHYVIAFFNFLLPLHFIAKVLPNIFLASLTIIVFLISKRITNNNNSSLFSAAIAGFLPVLYTTNDFTPTTLFLPLLFLNIYAFLHHKEQGYLYVFSFILLALTSPATFLLIIGFGIYILLSFAEGKKVKRAEYELIFFSLLFYIWTQFVFFKQTLLNEGIAFIWQNIPSQILQQYFPSVSILQAIFLVSIIPFFAGIITVYNDLFKLKNTKAFLLISFVVSTTILAWFKFIQFKFSLTFFSIILAILFAQFYQNLLQFLKKTKAPHLQQRVMIVTIILLLLTTVYPAVNTALEQETPSDEEILAFQWLKDYTPKTAGALALLEEGHLITYLGERRNLIDSQFSLVDDVNQRLAATNLLYTTPLQTPALDTLDRYGIEYVILTPSAKAKYDISKVSYLNPPCFQLVYKNETKVYRKKCTVKEVQ